MADGILIRELPVINFYNLVSVSKCTNYILIKGPDNSRLLRFSEYDVAHTHQNVFDLFRKEVALASRKDVDSDEFMAMFGSNFRCIGGGYSALVGEDSPYYVKGTKRQCWLHGKSPEYGEADFDTARRIIESSKLFDAVNPGLP